MGYFKIIMVGLFWLIKFITTPSDWYMVPLFIAALFIKHDGLRHYVNEWFAADDRKVYVMLGGKNSHHTISGYCGYMSLRGVDEYIQAEKVINALFFWQPNHCFNAIYWPEYKDWRG